MDAIISKLIEKFIEFFQSILKESGLWETFSDLANKIFG